MVVPHPTSGRIMYFLEATTVVTALWLLVPSELLFLQLKRVIQTNRGKSIKESHLDHCDIRGNTDVFQMQSCIGV